MAGRPRTARKEDRKYRHSRSWKQTDLTRAIGKTPAPRPRPRTPPSPLPRQRADPTFGRLLAAGYYDEYRKLFTQAED
jgi:hypothetical protein